jgi:uncharacterized protein
LSIAETSASPLVVWRFSDGKRGHDNQSLGLIEALSDLTPLLHRDIDVRQGSAGIVDLLLGRFPAGAALPDPQLLIGAGHATHLPMLAARRARGGRAIVLMKPSLPRRWFDLCVLPRHDNVADAAGVFITDGAINRIRPAATRDSRRAMILVGGPSAHFLWDVAATQRQIGQLIAAAPTTRWQIADSRRTPPGFLAGLKPLLVGFPEVSVVHWADVDGDWLASQMPQCAMIWVTADSVSMLYEALTTGAMVGVLPTAATGSTRVSEALADLQRRAMVVGFEDWRANPRIVAGGIVLNEAQRCARYIREHLLPSAG